MRNKFLLIIIAAFSLTSCEDVQSLISGYKTYEHPSLGFKISYPSNWTIKKEGSFGTQVEFYSDKSELFLANANITINKVGAMSLDQIADQSVKQLSILLKGYQILTKAYGNLGNIEGIDLRGKYEGKEGMRLLRSVIAFDGGMEYVFTFSCEAPKEKEYQEIINKMIDSFSL